jgi:hypothetical protein
VTRLKDWEVGASRVTSKAAVSQLDERRLPICLIPTSLFDLADLVDEHVDVE